MRKPIIFAVAALLVTALLTPARSGAQTQPYPDHPVRVIVPFPAGGLSDEVSRIVAQRLGEVLGQNFVVENRPGASGTLGAAAAAKANPDGYTLLMTTGDFITTPDIMPPLGFDPDKDLIPISMLAVTPVLLAANAGSGLSKERKRIQEAEQNRHHGRTLVKHKFLFRLRARAGQPGRSASPTLCGRKPIANIPCIIQD